MLRLLCPSTYPLEDGSIMAASQPPSKGMSTPMAESPSDESAERLRSPARPEFTKIRSRRWLDSLSLDALALLH